jgi:hypothetical protein
MKIYLYFIPTKTNFQNIIQKYYLPYNFTLLHRYNIWNVHNINIGHRSNVIKMFIITNGHGSRKVIFTIKLEAQWAEPVSLTFHSALRKLNTRSVNKHGHHRQFLFLIGRFLKIFSSETTWPNEPKLSRNIYGRSSITIAYFIPIR